MVPGSAGGELTAQMLADMPQKQFDAIFNALHKPPATRRGLRELMGS